MLEASCKQVAPWPPLRTLLLCQGCVLPERHLVCLAKLQSWLVFFTPSAKEELFAGGAGDMGLFPPACCSPQAACFVEGEFIALDL